MYYSVSGTGIIEKKKTDSFMGQTSCIPVRVKGGKSLRNGMWNGVRNGIIMRNTIYAGNKLTDGASCFHTNFMRAAVFSMLRTIKQPNNRSRIRKYAPGIEHV